MHPLHKKKTASNALIRRIVGSLLNITVTPPPTPFPKSGGGFIGSENVAKPDGASEILRVRFWDWALA